MLYSGCNGDAARIPPWTLYNNYFAPLWLPLSFGTQMGPVQGYWTDARKFSAERWVPDFKMSWCRAQTGNPGSSSSLGVEPLGYTGKYSVNVVTWPAVRTKSTAADDLGRRKNMCSGNCGHVSCFSTAFRTVQVPPAFMSIGYWGVMARAWSWQLISI